MVARGAANKRFLYAYAGHALDHLGVRRGIKKDCPTFPPQPEDYPTIVCPLCLQSKPLEEFEPDHTPQKSGASFFGRTVVVVLTCAPCNRIAGHAYEHEAANFIGRSENYEKSPFDCECHGSATVERRESGLLVVHDDTARTLATLKAAYLLGFHLLGYRWIESRSLDPVRAALLNGELPSIRHGYVIGVDSDSDDLVVVDKRGPRPGVIVRGPGKLAAVFPGIGALYAPRELNGPAKTYPWPNRPAGRKTFRFLWGEGHLHHLDTCRKCE